MDDVLSLNNSMLGDFVDRIYHIEFEVKDNKDTDRFGSTQRYIQVLLECFYIIINGKFTMEKLKSSIL
jgi:hypothetical protein